MREYKIIRSARKTVGMEVNIDGELTVRVPEWMSDEEVAGYVEKNEKWIVKALGKAEERRERHPEPTEDEMSRYITAAQVGLPLLVDHYARIMKLRPNGITITGAQKRFGSCSSKNSICFSWRLMAYPEAAIEYVVVHELAHIRHKNHGPEFYKLIESVLPDYKEREKLLK